MRKYITLLFVFIGLACFAQDGGNMDDSVKALFSAILDILVKSGVHIAAYQGAILAVLMFLWRFFEKRFIKQKHAAEKQQHADDIKAILEKHPEMEVEHVSAFKRLINKLEGKKDADKKS